ncbi:hypothetical protein CLV49_2842 [Labedella gwakjiensis]|uniref:Lipoprotein n=1 Tax=Labedella gwakjiensis TaxID=390269 RepID=A0A2P8GZ17_9MICO|nr:hypothetical protein [Labedella gwakjiensis]PSL39208.1 hypothetical protein CLV49_2842 [Labedella gwakjiensis]RUQ86362.1 hypothetical protein ELQ93_05030 [Labedella gwakjiensis]
MRKTTLGPAVVTALLASTVLLITGCTSTSPTEPTVSSSAAESSPDPSTEPSPEATEADGPADAFRAWLTASREPDTEAACALMTDALVDRMIAELAASGVAVSDCDEMISSTAALYAGLGIGADVDITVQEEAADSATLFVVYTDGGDCGTAVLERDAGTRWVINELSEECADGS